MRIGLKVIAASKQTFTWSHEGPDVHIGRDSECELHLGGDENQVVSWRHALIELRPGGACLSDCGTTNGTFVNGRRIETRVMLNLGDVIRLGHSGPQLKVTAIELVGGQGEIVELSHVGALIAREARPFSTTRMMVGLMQRNQKRTMLWGGAVLGTVFAVMFLVQWRYARQTSELGKQIVVATSEMNKKTSAFDQRVSAITEKVSTLTDGDADSIFRRYGEAVYFVVWQLADKQGQGTGSAFAIDSSGVFATNAHVAKPLHAALNEGLTAVLISQGGKRKYRIKEAQWHPSYRDHVLGYDVGVLVADVSGGEPLPVVVPRASDELRDLSPGSSLCYIGFPDWHPTDGHTEYTSESQLVATTYRGVVTRLLTAQLEQGTFSDQQIVEHDMQIWKGASGSPVFGKHGKAVAIVFAVQTREDLPFGRKFAVRIDLLEEVLRSQGTGIRRPTPPPRPWPTLRSEAQLDLGGDALAERPETFDKPPPGWPAFSGGLVGRMQVQITNPSEFRVRVGLPIT